MEGEAWQEPESKTALTPAQMRQAIKEQNEKALKAAWKVFRTETPTEKHAAETVFQCWKEQGLIKCRHCGNKVVEHDFGSRSVRCAECRKISWFTAGTTFDKVKCLRPWLAAIYFLSKGICFSASELRRLTRNAYSSSWGLMKRISEAIMIQSNPHAKPLPSACFRRIITKRSSDTPAGKYPYAEEEERQKSARSSLKTSRTTPTEAAAKLGAAESKVFSVLTSDLMHVDEIVDMVDLSPSEVLPALSMLTIAKLVWTSGSTYKQTVPGNIEQSAMESLSDALLDSAIHAIDVILVSVQGVSRKHLEMYLARYWCYMDRIRWGGDQLLRTCLRTSAKRLDNQESTDDRDIVVELFIAAPPDRTDLDSLAA